MPLLGLFVLLALAALLALSARLGFPLQRQRPVNRGNEILVIGGIRPPASAETARHVGGAESERRQHCENAGETKVKASGLEPTGVKRIASFVCLHARRTM